MRDEVREARVPHAGGFKRPSVAGLVGVAIRAGVPSRPVPQGRCHPCTDLEGRAQVAVECRCGHRPVVDMGTFPVKCECERWFYYAGTTVFALASPVK